MNKEELKVAKGYYKSVGALLAKKTRVATFDATTLQGKAGLKASEALTKAEGEYAEADSAMKTLLEQPAVKAAA